MKMASVKPRGDGWRAKIRRKGYPLQSKSFKSKAAAPPAVISFNFLGNKLWGLCRNLNYLLFDRVVNLYLP
jgi:hypothetical protein